MLCFCDGYMASHLFPWRFFFNEHVGMYLCPPGEDRLHDRYRGSGGTRCSSQIGLSRNQVSVHSRVHSAFVYSAALVSCLYVLVSFFFSYQKLKALIHQISFLSMKVTDALLQFLPQLAVGFSLSCFVMNNLCLAFTYSGNSCQRFCQCLLIVIQSNSSFFFSDYSIVVCTVYKHGEQENTF